MTDTRTTKMRGFRCAVARDVDSVAHQAAGVAVGIDRDGDDARIAVAVRHADGTMLTMYLSDSLLDRLTHLIADLLEPGYRPVQETLQ